MENSAETPLAKHERTAERNVAKWNQLLGIGMNKNKYYCYVDETGQDTKGKFFLVSVVLVAQSQKEALEALLEEIEEITGKDKTKWTKTKIDRRIRFLEEISLLNDLQSPVYYSQHENTTAYEQLTAHSLAKAIQARGGGDSSATVIIDALTKKGEEKIRRQLKYLQVKYDKILGLKDEQSPFLRLADSFAGFIRDYIEGDDYAKALFVQLKQRGIITHL